MKDLLPLLTAGTGAGIFLYTLMWLVKNLFPAALSYRERWIVFGLCYIPVTFCLIFTTMKRDGGKENPQDNQTPMVHKPKGKVNGLGYNYSPLNLLVTAAYADIPNVHKNPISEFCGVEPNTYTVYLSFNSDKPYFVNPGNNTKMRLVLLDINKDRGLADIEINNNGKPIQGTSKYLAELGVNKTFDFQYQECTFRITNLGYGHFTEGLLLLFRTRYFINIKLEKI